MLGWLSCVGSRLRSAVFLYCFRRVYMRRATSRGCGINRLDGLQVSLRYAYIFGYSRVVSRRHTHARARAPSSCISALTLTTTLLLNVDQPSYPDVQMAPPLKKLLVCPEARFFSPAVRVVRQHIYPEYIGFSAPVKNERVFFLCTGNFFFCYCTSAFWNI